MDKFLRKNFLLLFPPCGRIDGVSVLWEININSNTFVPLTLSGHKKGPSPDYWLDRPNSHLISPLIVKKVKQIKNCARVGEA